MTVATTINKIVYTADGATSTYSFPFAVEVNGQTDIKAFITIGGINTQLTYPTQYTVVLNPPIAPNPTGIGGSVTVTAVPANGTLVTILRTMAETQPTSLANQGTLYQPVIESQLDDLTMMIQQLQELLGRQITVAVSDSTPTALPPAAQRANLAFMFDGSGNPIAAPPGGANSPVSSAMAPVVNAATIAAAVALLGLSGVAPEPSGVVKAFAGTSLPTGYLFCNGAAVSRTGATATLFAALGTTYGVGNGSTTFNLPDLRARIPAGLDTMGGVPASGRLTSNTITGGATTLGNNNGNTGIEQIVLTQSQLPGVAPSFNQAPQYLKANPVSVAIVQGSGSVTNIFDSTPLTTTNTTGTTFNNLGSGSPINNVQPTIILSWIIKT